MGSGRLDPDDWVSYSASHITGRSVDNIYTSNQMDPALNPKGLRVRESCDSPDNPNSTAIIVGLDVSGSMGSVLSAVANSLGTLVTEIYERKPVSDPHLMFMGIDDAEVRNPSSLQVTQFEADIRIAQQLQKIHFEQGGGGNNYESYILAWYFAAMHTKIDCFEKRAKKGYLFTIGDEEITPYLRADDIEWALGYLPQRNYTTEEVYDLASRTYNIYHLIIEEGDHCRGYKNKKEVVNSWTRVLGQRAILVGDHTKVAEIIVSILQSEAGEDRNKIISSWDMSTGGVVAKAIDCLYKNPEKSNVIRF